MGLTKKMQEDKEEEENNPFSQYYGMLLHQQNMMQDDVRTGTYERAMRENAVDFKDKVVLDVGTGSGILAYFAVKAGARKVYAVELSQMADHAKSLMEANGLSDRIEVIKGKVEEIELPEKVDIVISEPMGFFLVHERMLETYVAGRIKWMKPGGLMFPSIGTMFVAPFSDDAIYREQLSKVSFWQQPEYYGLDLSCLTEKAMENHFSQPIVGYFPPSILISSTTVQHPIDFQSILPQDLHEFTIPFQFTIEKTSIMHGFGCWFTVDFCGTAARVVLSTGPEAPGTHWYQCRLLLSTPIAVNTGQSISGKMHFRANKKYSYDIELEAGLDGTMVRSRNHIRLHDQMYHYMYNGVSATTQE